MEGIGPWMLPQIIIFHAEYNKLSGEIPSTISECQRLQNLYLKNNFIAGGIPSSMCQLQGLETLDLSRNNLSGPISKFLGDLTLLYSMNILLQSQNIATSRIFHTD